MRDKAEPGRELRSLKELVKVLQELRSKSDYNISTVYEVINRIKHPFEEDRDNSKPQYTKRVEETSKIPPESLNEFLEEICISIEYQNRSLEEAVETLREIIG